VEEAEEATSGATTELPSQKMVEAEEMTNDGHHATTFSQNALD
jgi:hypothetical protein